MLSDLDELIDVGELMSCEWVEWVKVIKLSESSTGELKEFCELIELSSSGLSDLNDSSRITRWGELSDLCTGGVEWVDVLCESGERVQ